MHMRTRTIQKTISAMLFVSAMLFHPTAQGQTVERSDLPIRDPFVLTDSTERTYYLFGTNRAHEGYDGYKSKDLEHWEGPLPLFRKDDSFWGEKDFWAPECHAYRGKYYLFTTARGKADSLLGSYILVADSPAGPFREHSRGRLTPEGWNALDGTLYVDAAGDPWMVFCHEWTQLEDGTIEAVRLTKNLKRTQGAPHTLFSASQAPWVRSHVPGAGLYVTDGPFLLHNERGELLMLWSSFSDEGYAIGLSRSRSGDILGPWEHFEEPLFSKDGGHGMLFRTFDRRLMLAIHRPNHTAERAVFFEVRPTPDGGLKIARPTAAAHDPNEK